MMMKWPFAAILIALCGASSQNLTDFAESIARKANVVVNENGEGGDLLFDDEGDYAEGAVIFQQQFKDQQEINGVQLQIQVQIQIAVVTSDATPPTVPTPPSSPLPPQPTPPLPTEPTPPPLPPPNTCTLRTSNCENPNPDGFEFCSLVHTSLQNRIDVYEPALKRLEDWIVGDLLDIDGVDLRNQIGQLLTKCKCQIPDVIDDIVICVTEDDLPGRVIGTASTPVTRRVDDTTVIGELTLDTEFMKEADPKFINDVIAHEAGHLLGLVTSSRAISYFFEEYRGTEGLRVWREDWGCDGTPPLQPGISHWDEDCFTTELMTPRLNTGFGVNNELSAMSLAMLKDIGFVVAEDAVPEQPNPDVFLDKSACCTSQGRRHLRENQQEKDDSDGKKSPKLRRRLTYDSRVLLTDEEDVPYGFVLEDFEVLRRYADQELTIMEEAASTIFILDEDEFDWKLTKPHIEIYAMDDFGTIQSIEFVRE